MLRAPIDSERPIPFDAGMVDDPHLTDGKRAEQAARAARLARALRENLHRRKDQSRARSRETPGQARTRGAPEPPDGDPVA